MGNKQKKKNQKKTTQKPQLKVQADMKSGLGKELPASANTLVRDCPQVSSGRDELNVLTIVHNRSSESENSSVHSSRTSRSRRSRKKVDEPPSEIEL